MFVTRCATGAVPIAAQLIGWASITLCRCIVEGLTLVRILSAAVIPATHENDGGTPHRVDGPTNGSAAPVAGRRRVPTKRRGSVTSAIGKHIDGRSLLLSAISEEQWLQQVKKWATQGGWLLYHTRNSRGSEPGFPDCFAVRGGRAIAAELKTGSGRARADQRTWLLELQAAGIQTFVWRPEDADAVRAVLFEGVPLAEQVRRAMLNKSVKKVRPRSARSTQRGPTIRP